MVAEVAEELRTPILYLPMDITHDAMLGVARRLVDQGTDVRPGITSVQRAVAGRPTVPVEVYESRDRPRGTAALLWVHGGGTVMGSPATARAFCSKVADELGILVVSVDYRLAPEHPFPAGLHDCFAVLQWLHDEAAELGVDPDRIAVGGDSAGGGLAAALAQLARDEGGPSIAFQLLVYPMLDDRTVVRAEAEGRNALIWTRPSNRYAWTAYLGHAPSLDEERPHAAAARCEDLTGLPPAWIGVGEIDLFCEEDVDYAQRLQLAGVDSEVHVEPGMFHGADAVLPHKPSMRAFRDRAVTALAEGLGVP
jgi:acetyl esterase/lipase